MPSSWCRDVEWRTVASVGCLGECQRGVVGCFVVAEAAPHAAVAQPPVLQAQHLDVDRRARTHEISRARR
jgi:hypothetical protein